MTGAELSERRWGKLFAHPLRVLILRYLLEHGQAWPSLLAAKSGATLATVSYHVRVLRTAGQIVLVTTTARRGAVAHLYRLRDPEAVREALTRLVPMDRPDAAEVAASVAARQRLRVALGELRRRREAQGIRRDAFARRLGITTMRLARIERGEADPPFSVVMRIAHELGTTAGEDSTTAQS